MFRYNNNIFKLRICGTANISERGLNFERHILVTNL